MRRYEARMRRTDVFQSAPGREAGRCGGGYGRRVRKRGFNPRPAVRPGDAALGQPRQRFTLVSIRARP